MKDPNSVPQSKSATLSTLEASKILGIAPVTVTAHVRRGNLSAQKVSGVWVFPRAEIDRFAANHRQAGRPPRRRRKAKGTAKTQS